MMNMTYKIAELGIAARIEKLEGRIPYLRHRWHGDWSDRTSYPKDVRLEETIQQLWVMLQEVESVLYKGYSDTEIVSLSQRLPLRAGDARSYYLDLHWNRFLRDTEMDLDIEDGYENMARHIEQ